MLYEVITSFFYTNCPTADPDSAKLAEIRKLLDGDSGEEVRFVSVSADPERDTPEAVREYAKRHNAGKGRITSYNVCYTKLLRTAEEG